MTALCKPTQVTLCISIDTVAALWEDGGDGPLRAAPSIGAENLRFNSFVDFSVIKKPITNVTPEKETFSGGVKKTSGSGLRVNINRC